MKVNKSVGKPRTNENGYKEKEKVKVKMKVKVEE